MPSTDFSDIRAIKDFPSLIRYLRTDLGWPVDEEQADDLTFDYRPAELGLDEAAAVKIREIKQLRPLAGKQPWGIFWIDFEPKSLPVLVMRRILNRLVQKQRGQASSQKTWNLRDLLFISATGTGSQRGISFAHFEQDGEREQLRTFSWDVRETHLFYIKNLKLGQLHWPTNPADADAWRTQWGAAFTVEHRYVVRTAQQLAGEMARIAGEIREAVEALYAAEHSGGPLHQLHLSLKMTLITDLSEADFADMYAQTVAYGLFAARATHQGEFAAANNGVEALIAHTNPFLRELLGQLMNQKDMDFDGLGVNELVNLLRQVNMEEILMDFGRQKRGEDPVIHFYETFMKQYDPVQKTRRGEFYTPDPAVSFIVRSVDFLLRKYFNCPDGLMSTISTDGTFSPVILDPATGTGTFLRYVIMVVYETFCQKYKRLNKAELRAKWNEYVRASLLPRLYAFELKMSPYTIAHLKLGLTLQEAGFEFQEGERLRVFLSNALQPAHEVARVDMPALAHEMEQASEVKDKVPVTIVIGNPPYSKSSANRGEFAEKLVSRYKAPVKSERNIQPLSDDYIKFIAFSENILDVSGQGIVAMITNNSYINGVIHRGMREELLT